MLEKCAGFMCWIFAPDAYCTEGLWQQINVSKHSFSGHSPFGHSDNPFSIWCSERTKSSNWLFYNLVLSSDKMNTFSFFPDRPWRPLIFFSPSTNSLTRGPKSIALPVFPAYQSIVQWVANFSNALLQQSSNSSSLRLWREIEPWVLLQNYLSLFTVFYWRMATKPSRNH